MRAAYFHCVGGASGDMILGALLDAGLDLETLTRELRKLPLSEYHISIQRSRRGGITGTQVNVEIEGTAKKDSLRTLEPIIGLISQSSLPEKVKEGSSAIFRRLATAEAKVHRIPIEEVHFHEIGAMDTIIDVVGSVLGLHLLGIEEVFSSPLPTGAGVVSSQHGALPVPAPATLELIADAKAPVKAASRPGSPDGEMLTPTGAAIITTLASFQQPTLYLDSVGYGVGSRDYPDIPNVLCVWLGELAPAEGEGALSLLETNIDDMSPELYGHVMERLFQSGALDVWFTPIQMKKNRPATMLSILAPQGLEGTLVEAVLQETSTLGIRISPVQRHEALREVVEFSSSLGPVQVKIKSLGGAAVGLSPEFESCRRIALERNMPLQEVYRIVTAEASDKFLKK